MTLKEAAERTLRALRHATAEHGRPNHFGFDWLYEVEGSGVRPMLAGRAMRLYIDWLAAEGAALAPAGGIVVHALPSDTQDAP